MSEVIRRLIGGTPRGTIVWGNKEFAAPRPAIQGNIAKGDLAGAVSALAIERLSALGGRPRQIEPRLAGADETFVNFAAEDLLEKYAQTGKVPQELIEFYAARGVPTETLEKFASGALPMDEASRRARAAQMGLVFDDPTVRYDYSGKDQFRGRSRSGMVYTGLHLDRARGAAQAKGQAYPLIGQPVLGLHQSDADYFQLAGDKRAEHEAATILNENWGHDPEKAREEIASWETYGKMLSGLLEEQAMLPYSPASSKDAAMMRGLREPPALGVAGVAGRAREVAPDFREYETQVGREELDPSEFVGRDVANVQMRKLLDAQGVGGILVKDEGPLSVAYHNAPTLRHASLSLLDPDSAGKPGIYRSVAPIAAAAGLGGKDEDSPRKKFPIKQGEAR